METKDLIDSYFNDEGINNEISYDPIDVDVNDPHENIRTRFNIYETDPITGGKLHGKIADGAGHYEDCPFCVVEVKSSDISRAISQLKNTAEHIYKEGFKVRKTVIFLDENQWDLNSDYYKIEDDLLYKKGSMENKKLIVKYEGEEYLIDIYCYKIDFQEFGMGGD